MLKRVPSRNCEYLCIPLKKHSRFGPFEDQKNKKKNTIRNTAVWMLKMCCEIHSCLLARSLARSFACLPSCAKSAFSTLSYFYSLALYLVYVRALRIACEHLCVSHTQNMYTITSHREYTFHCSIFYMCLVYLLACLLTFWSWFLSFVFPTSQYTSPLVFHLNVNNNKELPLSLFYSLPNT